MDKQGLLETLRFRRKKYGKNHPMTFKAIQLLVRNFPYYKGYEDYWIRKNGNYLK